MTDIRTEVDAFLERSDMAPSVFGMKAVGDPNLVRRLRKGGDVTTRTAGKIQDFIRANEPAPEKAQGAALSAG